MKKVFQSLKNGKKRIVTSLISIFFLGLFVSVIYIFVPNNQTKANPGWLTSWTYRKPITINNTSNSNTLTNYQVLVTVDTATLISQGKLQSDCDDIRFTDSDETTLLNYWLESGCNTTSTKIWVKVDSIPASSNKTIYMYYGRPSAPSGSSGNNTFVFFDNFEYGLDNWTKSGQTIPTYASDVTDPTGSALSGRYSAYTRGTYPGTVSCAEHNYDGVIYRDFTLGAGSYILSFINRTSLGSTGYDKNRINLLNITDSTTIKEWSTSGCGNGTLVTGTRVNYGPLTTYNQTFTLSSTKTLRFYARSHNGGWQASMLIDNILIRAYSSPEPTTTIGIETQNIQPNNAPVISSISDSPDPLYIGSTINFNINWSDPDVADLAKIHICKTNSISNHTCSGGSWCDSFDWASNSPTFCSYTTQLSDTGINTYYAFVCDYYNSCSLATSSSFTVNPITFDYRKPITINNTSNSNTLTNYQVLVTVDTATLISQGKLQSDCDDIRFTDNSTSYNTANWTNNYPYWLESGCNTTSTKIWVKVDSIPASSNKTIYMYYGNASASSGSDVGSTFISNQIFVQFWRHPYHQTSDASHTHDHPTTFTAFNQLVNDIFGSYPYSNLKDGEGYTTLIYDSFGDSYDNNPYGNGWDYIAWFKFIFVPQISGTYTFSTDSDDASDIILNPTDKIIPSGNETLIVGYYGAHGVSGVWNYSGTIALEANKGYWLAYRYTEGYGTDTGRMGVKIPGGSFYQEFNTLNFPNQIFARKYTSPEPTTTVGSEQSQIILTYRKPITINNTSNSNTLTNYQVLVTVDTATLISQGKLQSDCDDLRFTDNSTSYNTADWTNNYPYWLESGCNTTSTKIWVKVDSIPASSNKTIYMYYGNASASSGSDGNSTFDFFDDFNGTSLDTDKWDLYQDGGVSISNSWLILQRGSASNFPAIYSKINPFLSSNGYLIKLTHQFTSYAGCGDGVVFYSGGINGSQTVGIWGDTGSAASGDISISGSVLVDGGLGTGVNEITVIWDTTKYFLYLNNIYKGFVNSTSRLDSIELGNRASSSCSDWTDFKIDNILIRKYTSPEPTASFNNAPTINSVNVMPNPVKTGAGVSFNVNWSDPDSGDLVKIHICKSNAISSQTCTGGSWCDLASFSNKNPATCTYVPTNSNIGINNYYAFVCDDDNACSSVSSGTFTVESASSPQKIALSNTSSGGVITSAIFDTGVVGGAAFHSILWQGTLNNGVVKFQLACSNSKSGPWTYYGPTSTADYYQPAGPNIPVPIAKTGNASCQNKRYIRYKMFIEPSAGGTSPIVDDVIINWSP